jgi:predicted amidophosphoribosyltransferase
MMNEQADQTICRHCGGPNETHFFVCPTCWKKLPQSHRAAFGALKIKSLRWLREFAPQLTKMTSTRNHD